MTPEQHAAAVLKNWEDDYYSIADSELEVLIAAAIRDHEAEVRKEYEAARQSIKRPPDELLRQTEAPK